MEFRRHKWISFALSALALAWAAIVLSLYYFVHKPITTDHLTAVGQLIWLAIGLLGMLSLAFVLGGLWSRSIGALPSGEAFVIRLGAGFASLSLITLGLGAIGAYQAPIAIVAVVFSFPFGLRGFAKELRKVRLGPIRDRLDRLFVILIVIMAVIALLRALTPPTAWDSLVYHLAGPKLYLAEGELHHGVDLPYLGFPQGGSMLFVWALMLSSPALAQVLHLVFAAMTLLLVRSIAHEVAPKTEWLSMALLVSVPSAALLASWAYVEWMTMFGAVAAFRLILLQKNQETGNAWGYAVIGVMLGFSFSTKYSAVGVLAGLGITLALVSKSLRKVVVSSLAFFAFIAPFLLKNMFLTHNPVYPFFFSGKYWDVLRADWYSRPGTGLSLIQTLTAPWDATVWGVEGATIVGRPSYGADLGPLLLVLIPLMAIVVLERKKSAWGRIKLVFVVASVATIAWLAMLAYSGLLVQTRLLFPALPFLVILAAAGLQALHALGRRGASAYFVLKALVAFVISITTLGFVLREIANPSLPVVLGTQSTQEYLEMRLGEYAFMMNEIGQLPEQAHVRFLWEPRGYYCPEEVQCDPDALLDRWWHARRTLGSAESIAEAWRIDGVTHVLLFRLGRNQVEQEGFDPFTNDDWRALDQFVEQELITVGVDSQGYGLYRMRTPGNG
jgi:hypothetical protein